MLLGVLDSMHIRLISRKFPTAGFLWAVAQGLTQHGHEVTVLTQRSFSGAAPALNLEGVTVYGLIDARGSGKEFTELALNKFEEIHRERPFQLVHSIDSSGWMIGRHRKTFRIAMIYDVNATHLAKLFSILGTAQETLGSLLRISFSVAYNFMKSYYVRDRRLLKLRTPFLSIVRSSVWRLSAITVILTAEFFEYPSDFASRISAHAKSPAN